MDIKDRMRGSIWGQLVGDAAALGTHWIYDSQELAARNPQGFDEPLEGHYHFGKHSGDQTHYGDGALVMLESVAELGRFDAADFARRFNERFSHYDGYLDHATKGTLERFKTGVELGADDDQLATASRLASVVVAHHDDPHLGDIAERATRVTQDNDYAVSRMRTNAAMLAAYLGGGRIHAVDSPSFQAAAERSNLSVSDATIHFGKACPLPQSFPSAIQTMLRHPDDFEAAILACVRAGGDNAGRAALLGGWMGARLGFDAIPAAWRERLSARERIEGWVEKLVGHVTKG